MKKYDDTYGKTSGKRDVVVGPVLLKCVKAATYWTECVEEYELVWDEIKQWLEDVPTDEAFKEYVVMSQYVCHSMSQYVIGW